MNENSLGGDNPCDLLFSSSIILFQNQLKYYTVYWVQIKATYTIDVASKSLDSTTEAQMFKATY